MTDPYRRIRPGTAGATRTYRWEPQPDITAAELAEAISLLFLPPQLVDEAYGGMTDEVKRHFATQTRSKLALPA